MLASWGLHLPNSGKRRLTTTLEKLLDKAYKVRMDYNIDVVAAGELLLISDMFLDKAGAGAQISDITYVMPDKARHPAKRKRVPDIDG